MTVIDIGKLLSERNDLNYDAIGLSEDEKTLGIGFANNDKSSILIKQDDEENTFSIHFNENLKPQEVLIFFITFIEKICAKFIIREDFT